MGYTYTEEISIVYLKFNWIVFAKDGNSSKVRRAEVSFGGTDIA